MLSKIKEYKTELFFTLALLTAIANLFGFAEFNLTSQQTEWLSATVAFIGLLLSTFTHSPARWPRGQ